MALETNLSRSPYFDTFSTDSGYHQILFRPAVAVQTRELNELQSIQQDQISKFGRQIFTEGSVVEGCQLSFENNIPYVKIIDEYANGSAFGNVNEFFGLTVKNAANISAIILNTYPGSIGKSATGDLNTLYVRYTQASDSLDQKYFNAGEQLTLYTASGNQLGNVVVANTTVTGPTKSTGFGYIVHAQEGVIFQKGYFIRTEPQSFVLSKYNSYPNNISVGFTTIETLDTPESNTMLLDNASGAPNYSAPGAHRLKLKPILTSRATLDTTTSGSFFSIADFSEGRPSIIRTDPSYSNLGKQLAERTYDESGNYIINPFYIRLATKYDDNNVIIPGELKLEIEKGLAYINGYRIETVGKLVNTIRRGTDTKNIYRQTVTSTMGSYIFVKEFAGIFDPTSFQKISLRSAATHSISGRTPGSTVSSLSPAGAEIGTANIIAVEYDSGVPGTADCKYRVYLTNIICNEFSKVKSIYATNGSTKEGYADPDLEFETCVLKDSTLQTLTFPYNQKAIKTLFGFSEDLNKCQFDFKAKADITIGLDGHASIPVQTVTGGRNLFPYSGSKTLNNILERDFIITYTKSSGVTAANIAGYITGTSGSKVLTGHSTYFSQHFSNGNLIRISNGSSDSYKRIASIDSNIQITLTTNLGDDQTGTGTKVAYALVSGEPIGSSILPNAYISISEDQQSANLELNRTFSASLEAEVLYNIRRYEAKPLKKKLYQNLLVKIDTSSAIQKNIGPWCLGVPDVYRITKVYVGDNYTINSMIDRTSSFVLDNGQRDAFYDLGYLTRKTAVTIEPGKKILVEFEAFVADAATGKGYYSIDSYPIDDTGVTANTILTKNIPIFNSSSSGTYDLRNTVDFRVISANTVVYTKLLAEANTNPPIPNSTPFSVSSLGFVPVPESSFESDLEYYVGRYDKIGMDAFGNIKIAEGAPDENPIPPTDIPSMMTLAMVKVPPFPSLPPSEAIASGRSDISTDITYYKNRRYTMRDISTLDKRIEKLEYYTSLSTLELSTKTLLIENQTGGNRFQYGILVDSFRGHDVGSTTDPQYRIAIDYEATEARPMVEDIRIDLNYIAGTGHKVSDNSRVVSLDYDTVNEDYIAQPFASKYRNCAQDVTFVYEGFVSLDPEGNWDFDSTESPPLNINLDLYTNLATIADAMGTIVGAYRETASETQVDKPITTTTDTSISGGTLHASTTNQSSTTKSTQTAATTKLEITAAKNTTYDYGPLVDNIAYVPWIKPQILTFSATGLKPNAILYAYFDDVSINQYCKAYDGVTSTSMSSTLKVKSDGSIRGTFTVPSKTFSSGERVFKLADVDNLAQGSDFIQTQCSTTFFGTNLSYSTKNITLNTTTGQLSKKTGTDVKVISTVKTSTNFSVSFTPTPPPTNQDPLIQTFSVNEQENVAGIFLESIDLYFFKKDLARGIRIEIREMFNGYPGMVVLPFSSVHLNSSQVSISSDSSVRTKFKFPAPVFVENQQQYAIAILPDASSPDYGIWIAERDKRDVISGSSIFTNSGVGVMFTSSDNKTWTPYQKEDVKFGLSIYNFKPINTNVDIQFTNDNSEYISANDLIGTFTAEEKVYFSNNTIDTSVSVDSVSATITGISSTSSISVNDWIYLRNSTGSNSIIRKVINKTGDSVIVDGLPTFTDEVSTIGKLSGNGDFYGYLKTVNYSNGYIIIGKSTANSTVYLTPDHKILASKSEASATINTINNIVYNVIMPKFAISTPPLTTIDFSIKGIANTFDLETNYNNLIFAQETPFYDKERVILSRSNELHYNTGKKSLFVNARFNSSNSKLSPVIDLIKAGFITTHNIINSDVISDKTQALTIQYNTANGTFNKGDQVALIVNDDPDLEKTGNVIYSYASNTTHGTIIINNLGGDLVPFVNPADFVTGNIIKNMSVSGNVVATMRNVNNSLSILASEKTPGDGTAKARYISKKVVLADGQEAEDIKLFIAAYKPAGTEMYVFAKFWNGADPESFDSKQWTQLSTPNSLISNKSNTNDFIEYQYGLSIKTPSIINITANSYGFSNSTDTIVVDNVANSIFQVGDRIYYGVPDTFIPIAPLVGNSYYFVSFANDISIALSSVPGGANVNIVDDRQTSIGEIHSLRDDKATDYTAFLNSDNENILRYYNRDGSIFDTYKAYAIKIVLLSSDSSVVPRLQDYRTVAVSSY